MSLQTWEQEVLSLAAYLASNQDPVMVMVYTYCHLRLWAEKVSLVCYRQQIRFKWLGNPVAFSENPPLGEEKVICELQKAQVAQLISNVASKQHQGKFLRYMQFQAALNETLSV